MTEAILQVLGLNTWFRSPSGVVRAVNDVSLAVSKEQTLGVVGESGSGKSALVRSIMGLYDPRRLARYDGQVFIGGTDLRSLPERELRELWGRRIGIIFQDPLSSLNPVVRVGRQITEVLRHRLGLGSAESRDRAIELMTSVGIADAERRFQVYPHELSGGMRQRVTIAIALACEPEVLIADEPTTALDVTVQAQILALLSRLQEERGMALVLVSHDLGVVSGLADDVAVMYAGRIVEYGSAPSVIEHPRMPYTAGLIAASPSVDRPRRRHLPTIRGRPPSLVGEQHCCAFWPRCAKAAERCRTERPGFEADETGRRYACWYPVDASDKSEPAHLGFEGNAVYSGGE